MKEAKKARAEKSGQPETIAAFARCVARRTPANPFGDERGGRNIGSITSSTPELNPPPGYLDFVANPGGEGGPAWQRAYHSITDRYLASHREDGQPASRLIPGDPPQYDHTSGDVFWYQSLAFSFKSAISSFEELTVDDLAWVLGVQSDEIWGDVRHGYLPWKWGSSERVIDSDAFYGMVDAWTHAWANA